MDNNSKMVLGLLWRVITKYHIQSLFADEDITTTEFDGKASTDGNRSLRGTKTVMAKSLRYIHSLLFVYFKNANNYYRDSLLRWCKTELEAYDITPINFTKSFQSPVLIAGLGTNVIVEFWLLSINVYLVHKQNSGSINMEEIDKVCMFSCYYRT